MKGIYLKGVSIVTLKFILSCSVMIASTSVQSSELHTQVGIEISTQDTSQVAAYGVVEKRAGMGTIGNLMIPGATTTPVEKIPVYKLTTFPEMRRGLEKLFDSYVTETGGFGPLYTGQVHQYGNTLVDEATTKPTFTAFMGTKYSQQYLAKQGMTQELSNLAKYTFKDVKGTEWYSSLIPLSVYYGIVNGYEDGTFRGTQPVTRAELAVILGNYKDNNNQTNYISTYGDTWYVGSLHMLDSSPLAAYRLNKTSIIQGTTRGEVAVILADIFALDKVSKYSADIASGNIKNYVFSDVKGYVSSIEEDRENNIIKDVSGYYPAYQTKLKNPSKPPSDVLAAMLALNEVNVMQGDSAGNCNWTKTVTRSEILAFLQKGEMRSSALTR